MTHPLRWLALIPLAEPQMPAFDDVAAWFAAQFPAAPKPAAAGSTDKLLTFTLGEFTAAATLVPRPIPWSQLEGPAATAWHWPEAAQVLREHAAHLLVALVDEGGPAVNKSMILTELTAALAAVLPSLGVFWGPSRMVHERGAFIDQATQMAEDNLPLFLWIDFRIEQVAPNAVRLFTTGLETLGQPELECQRFDGQPQELLNFAYNVAHYVLRQRKVIRDGDTIGLTDEVQVTVRRGPSMLDSAMEVIRLEFEDGGHVAS